MSQVTDEKKKMKEKISKTYQAPQLIVYGALKNLTASGTSGGKEGTAGTGTAFMV